MKKRWFVIIVLCIIGISNWCYSQTLPYDTLLRRGKDEFEKYFENQDYQQAVFYLEQAVALRPDNAEAHYFLGYAYSRLNTKDGNNLNESNVQLTLKTSEQFEIVNRLSPKYEGEIVVLDPYSKLSSEWGSLAMTYWYKNMPDSAIWALNEGKKRGGFSDFFLSIFRKTLDFCLPNSILISYGDNSSFSLFYLQILENYRTDITVIDISLLNTNWYPNFLLTKHELDFGVTEQELDFITYTEWKDSVITIPTSLYSEFTWTVKPSYEEKYLLRSDILFLNLLKTNRFGKEVYFIRGIDENCMLSLKDYLNSYILVEQISYDNSNKISLEEYKSKLFSIIDCFSVLNSNSRHELNYVDFIRYEGYSKISELLNNNQTEDAKLIFNILNSDLNPTKYPFQSEQSSEYYDYLKSILK